MAGLGFSDPVQGFGPCFRAHAPKKQNEGFRVSTRSGMGVWGGGVELFRVESNCSELSFRVTG